MVQNDDKVKISNDNNIEVENENNQSDDGFSWGKAFLGLAAAGIAVATGIAVSKHIEKKKKEQEPSLLGLVAGGVATGVGALIDSASSAVSDARQLNNRDLVNQSLYGSGMQKAAAEVEFQRRAGLR